MSQKYVSPLSLRYASDSMQELFSQEVKFTTWRKLWVALAQTQQELGLPITDQQIKELQAHVNDLNLEVAKAREKEVRHDVMAHVYAYGKQCPNAAKIIHLGATSCYVGDNTDLIIMKQACEMILSKLLQVVAQLKELALKHKDLVTLGFTHFQAAQPTTVGKRMTLWLNEFLMDVHDLEYIITQIKFLGSKGTTGTQASFMELFENDEEKVKQLDSMIAKKMGFDQVFGVSGQTYSRKLDARVLNVLSGIAQSAHKFSNDLRLLQHLKEIEEPFEKHQIGSSAMAYKRNPMRSERISSLAKYIISNAANPIWVTSTQWFERTLDDSANKRLSIPESFLACDGLLDLVNNVLDGLVVYPKVIEKHLNDELPFMATENIMMKATKAGGNRQELHELIREYSMQVSKRIKQDGLDNNLLELISQDKRFNLSKDEIQEVLNPALYAGRSACQVTEFIEQEVNPLLDKYQVTITPSSNITL